MTAEVEFMPLSSRHDQFWRGVRTRDSLDQQKCASKLTERRTRGYLVGDARSNKSRIAPGTHEDRKRAEVGSLAADLAAEPEVHPGSRSQTTTRALRRGGRPQFQP